MIVIIDEPRDNCTSFEINGLRIRPGERPNLLIGSDGRDAFTPNRYGLLNGEEVIDRDDLAVEENRVGRLLCLDAVPRCKACSKRKAVSLRSFSNHSSLLPLLKIMDSKPV